MWSSLFVCVGTFMGYPVLSVVFFFQAEDGIRDLVRSRGLGDVYKRQGALRAAVGGAQEPAEADPGPAGVRRPLPRRAVQGLSLIHI